MKQISPGEWEAWMGEALAEARRAAAEGEVPVGAVLLDPQGQVLASDHNRPIGDHDPTAHAEIRVLRAAAAQLRNYRLTHCSLIVTLEPCVMCVGAIHHARLARVIYGARDPKAGAVESQWRLSADGRFNHQVEWRGGVMAEPAADLLRDFFRQRRDARSGPAKPL